MSVAFPALLLLGLLSVAVEGVAYNGKDYTFHSVMINYADAREFQFFKPRPTSFSLHSLSCSVQPAF